MSDLWEAFPDLQPSAIKRVLDSLEQKGPVESSGDPHKAYLGGVHWWSTALAPTAEDPRLAVIVEALQAAGVDHTFSADHQERQVSIFLPLVEVESVLQGLPSASVDRIANAVQRAEAAGTPTRLTIATEVTMGREPLLTVKLAPAEI